MKTTIRRKIIMMTFFLISISLLTLGYLSFKGVERSVLKNTEAQGFTQVSNINSYFLSNFMNDMEYIVDRWASDQNLVHFKPVPGQEKMVRDVPFHFRPVTDTWYGTITTNPDVAWMYFGSEADGSLYLAPLDPTMPLDYDCRVRDWYQSAVNNRDRVIWTEPYLDAGDSGEIIVTVAKAVFNKDALVGVFGIDLKLSKFSDIIQDLEFVEGGALMLIGNDGYIFAHPDKRMVTTTLTDATWADAVLSNPEGSYTTTYMGEENIVSYLSVPNTNWKLVGISPVNTAAVLAPIKSQTVSVGIFALTITFFVGSLLARNLTEPAEVILSAIQKATAGDYKVSASVGSKDEFQELSTHFNKLIRHTESLLSERDSHVRILTEKNIEITRQQQEIMQYSEETIALNEELTQLIGEIRKNYVSTVRVLANAIEAKDEYTRGHCDRVRDISLSIAKRMDLPLSDQNDLEFACLLHDIGKIGIPSSILNKKGALNFEEYHLVKKHPMIGFEILKDVDFLESCNRIIVQHHERFDGKGYPNNLEGEGIELPARILTVADAYDAMTSDRPYRTNPMAIDGAIAELIKGKATQFDPDVVDVFVDMLLEDEQAFTLVSSNEPGKNAYTIS